MIGGIQTAAFVRWYEEETGDPVFKLDSKLPRLRGRHGKKAPKKHGSAASFSFYANALSGWKTAIHQTIGCANDADGVRGILRLALKGDMT